MSVMNPVSAAVLAALSLGLASQASAQALTLTSVKAAAAPTLDGDGSDAAWKAAKPVTIKLSDGANFGGKGETTATIKSVYAGDMVNFLIEYADPTESKQRVPFVKQPDGSWQQLKDPNDKGGDNNVYYEDKWSMIWPIGNSIKNFDTQGCGPMCHAGEPGKPYGNKYTATEGEIGDIWHSKTMRTGPMGHVDDQYVDHTRYDPEKAPGAGRKSDPGACDYKSLKLADGKPPFMNKDAKPANKGGNYWIAEGTEVPFDDSKFKPGDEVAAHISCKLAGDRADIKIANRWANGKWTAEISRKLVTGSKFDVQFDKLDGTYYFGFAAFDNAQVRHAVHYEPVVFKFAK